MEQLSECESHAVMAEGVMLFSEPECRGSFYVVRPPVLDEEQWIDLHQLPLKGVRSMLIPVPYFRVWLHAGGTRERSAVNEELAEYTSGRKALVVLDTQLTLARFDDGVTETADECVALVCLASGYPTPPKPALAHDASKANMYQLDAGAPNEFGPFSTSGSSSAFSGFGHTSSLGGSSHTSSLSGSSHTSVPSGFGHAAQSGRHLSSMEAPASRSNTPEANFWWRIWVCLGLLILVVVLVFIGSWVARRRAKQTQVMSNS